MSLNQARWIVEFASNDDPNKCSIRESAFSVDGNSYNGPIRDQNEQR